ncbi:MAG: alpha/beta hydrolase [Anaerolineales bacterium]|nr:alpha/beta hydrolase [Anaerolineales bacterium]
MAEGKFLSTTGLEIYYQEYGGGRPLILLHGATDTHKLWSPFIPELSKIFQVFTPDSRGHGRTFNPAGELNYQTLADDLAAFIQELDLEKPFIFGYSDGGQTALDFGMRYPDIAGALVIGGAWYRFSAEYQDALKQVGFIGVGEINLHIYEKFAPADWRERMGKYHPNPDPNYPEVLLRSLSSLFWTPLNYDKEDFLKIQAPTLILVGEQDELVPPEESWEMAALIPGAELALIPGATHTQVIIPGGECLPIVIDFLLRQLD